MYNAITWKQGTNDLLNPMINTIAKKLMPEIDAINAARAHRYATRYASINLPFDTKLREDIKLIIRDKKKLNSTMLIVIGIGGSNLGTKAVAQALLGSLYNKQETREILSHE